MIRIDPKLAQLCPRIRLGVLAGKVQVAARNDEIWQELNETAKAAAARLESEQELARIPAIAASRAAYKACGKEPSRYRVSSEALMRRVLSGKGLYQINSLVDLNNLVSIKSMMSVGTADRGKLSGPLVFRIGKDGESYVGIGKDQINLAGLPVFSDSGGPYGSPTSDSERTKITLDTEEFLMAIISFGEGSDMSELVDFASERLTRILGAKDLQKEVVQAT